MYQLLGWVVLCSASFLYSSSDGALLLMFAGSLCHNLACTHWRLLEPAPRMERPVEGLKSIVTERDCTAVQFPDSAQAGHIFPKCVEQNHSTCAIWQFDLVECILCKIIWRKRFIICKLICKICMIICRMCDLICKIFKNTSNTI